MTDLLSSQCVVTDGIMLCCLPGFCLVYTVDRFVNEERFSCTVTTWKSVCNCFLCLLAKQWAKFKWKAQFSGIHVYPCSAEALVSRGEKINYRLIAYSLRNIAGKSIKIAEAWTAELIIWRCVNSWLIAASSRPAVSRSCLPGLTACYVEWSRVLPVAVVRPNWHLHCCCCRVVARSCSSDLGYCITWIIPALPEFFYL